jgi:hypothetical protein
MDVNCCSFVHYMFPLNCEMWLKVCRKYVTRYFSTASLFVSSLVYFQRHFKLHDVAEGSLYISFTVVYPSGRCLHLYLYTLRFYIFGDASSH